MSRTTVKHGRFVSETKERSNVTKPNKTEIIFVVDRSGSMTVIAQAMSTGFDEFINKQKQVPGECLVTATQFDDTYDVLYTALPIHQVPPYVLQPRGMTALLDAIGRTIDAVGERLRKTPENERPSQVLFVIITDGGENASQEHKGEPGRKAIFDKITHQRTQYAWEFVFLGANQDAIAVGTSLGVSATNSVTYAASVAGSSGLMRGLSANVASYRQSGQSQMDNLYDQASYNATMAGMGSPDPNVPDPSAILGGTSMPDQLLKDDTGIKVPIDSMPAAFPVGHVMTIGTTVLPKT
jgi:uncharacterized protein YegL